MRKNVNTASSTVSDHDTSTSAAAVRSNVTVIDDDADREWSAVTLFVERKSKCVIADLIRVHQVRCDVLPCSFLQPTLFLCVCGNEATRPILIMTANMLKNFYDYMPIYLLCSFGFTKYDRMMYLGLWCHNLPLHSEHNIRSF